MKRIIIAALVTFSIQPAISQFRPYINEIIKEINSSANAFFLSANRPSYGVSSYLTPKNHVSIGTGIYFNRDLYEIPFDISYGVSDKFELAAGLTGFMQTYNFLGEKVRGVGDSYIGMKYRFQESSYFDHVLQAVVKIPTASKSRDLGTGKFDFYFGLAQGFAVNRFSYEIGLECNLLARRDFPSRTKDMPMILRAIVDSLKQKYDYKYEPEIVVSFSPAYGISDNLYLYTGYNFQRNTRLNFNTHSLLGGIGISTSDYFSISLGSSYGLEKNSGWYADIGLNFLISPKKQRK